MAVEHGCKIAVNTDAHSIGDLQNMELGIATARRGWAKKEDLINSQSLNKLLKLLN